MISILSDFRIYKKIILDLDYFHKIFKKHNHCRKTKIRIINTEGSF